MWLELACFQPVDKIDDRRLRTFNGLRRDIYLPAFANIQVVQVRRSNIETFAPAGVGVDL